jgi:zinc transport system permease protein
MEILQHDFMVRALIAAVLVGVTAPMVGIYLVQRRITLIGDGIGHVALTGVAIGVLTGTSPIWAALVCSVIAAVAIELIRWGGRSSADVALAVIFYGGIAGGVVLISQSSTGSSTSLNAYLFGSIATTSRSDLAVFAALAAVVVVICVGFAQRLFAVSNDEEYARASGMNVLGMNVLLAVLTATTVVVSMRIVGLLLISALMIVPNAAAQQLARSFASSLGLAVTIGLLVSLCGTATSYYWDAPSGGTIVLFAIAVYVLAAVTAAVLARLHARRHHPALEHHHEHGPGCGHPTVPHGDHVDYLHDGHLHAPHGAGYDDHEALPR